jgi:hypothetical protein
MALAGDPWHMQQAEDHRTTYHGMTERQVKELTEWWVEQNSRYVRPGVWRTAGVPVWLEILANSVRRA